MGVEQVFTVLTDFRFEIGSAVASSGKLQSAVEGVSTAAQEATNNLKYLGVSFGTNLLGGGLISGLYTMIKAADKFRLTQIALANTLPDMVKGADGKNSVFFTWADRLSMAEGSLNRMVGLANEFALPVDDLITTAKILTPMLHGDISKATDLSRYLLKSAPTLGIPDPAEVQGQLLRAIGGHASGGDRLMQRLISDVPSFAAIASGGSGKGGMLGKFNALPEAKRVEALTNALKYFAQNAGALTDIVDTFNGQLNIFQNNMTSMVGMFSRIGQVIQPAVVNLMKGVNKYIETNAPSIARSLGRIIQTIIENPRRTMATVMSARNAGRDLKRTGEILGVVGLVAGLGHVLTMLGIPLGATISGLLSLRNIFVVISTILSGGFVVLMGSLVLFLKVLAWALGAVLVPLAALYFLLSLISRARAHAQISEAEALIEKAPELTRSAAIFTRIFDLLNEGFDTLAQWISPLFSFAYWIKLGADLLETTGGVLAVFMSWLSAFFWGIFELITQFKSLVTGGGFSFEEIKKSMSTGYDLTMERILGGLYGPESKGVSNKITNIGKVEINNEFKEQLEPDRIAFTLKEQILKAAQNGTAARGSAMANTF